MTIIRELVTLVRFTPSGTEDVESQIDRLKHGLLDLAALFGLALGAHKIAEMSDEWQTLNARVGLVTDGVNAQTAAMETLYHQAENTGQSIEGLGQLFVQISQSKDSLGYTTEQVLGLTESISKLLAVSGGTRASQQRAIIQFDEMLSLNKFSGQHLKALMVDSPGFVNFLSEQFGGKDKLLEMAHAGQLTGKMVSEAIIKGTDKINDRFSKMPMTFARAAESIHTEIGKLVFDIGKATGVFGGLATAGVVAVRWITDEIRVLANAVGGWNNLLLGAGALLVGAFGPAALAMVYNFGKSLLTTLLNPWTLVVVAIAGVVLLLADVYQWISGQKDTVTADLVGPFKEWQDYFAEIKQSFLYGFTELKEAFLDAFNAEERQRIKDDFKELERSIGALFGNKDNPFANWSFPDEIRRTLHDFAEFFRSLGAAADFLNNHFGVSRKGDSDAPSMLKEKGLWGGALSKKESSDTDIEDDVAYDRKFREGKEPTFTEQPDFKGLENTKKFGVNMIDLRNALVANSTPLSMPATSIAPQAVNRNTTVNVGGVSVNNTVNGAGDPAAVANTVAQTAPKALSGDEIARALRVAHPNSEIAVGY